MLLSATRRSGIPSGEVTLTGRLTVPARAIGTVVFAHGSGSSRHSPRNRYVASVLNRAGLATLLIDLLTVEEESDRSCVFDVHMLADRLGDAPAGPGTSLGFSVRSASSGPAPARRRRSGRPLNPTAA